MSELYYPKDLIDKYRDVLVGHGDWYESVYEHFKEMMSVIGIRVDKVYFSGFWSQGDGACFDKVSAIICNFLRSNLNLQVCLFPTFY